MNILVVDDVAESRSMLEYLLTGSGYEVCTAENGAEAFQRLEAGGVHMIISDILMPVMDGFELCRKVRAHERFHAVPFIIYTATYTGPKDEAFSVRIGADRFLVKPCEPAIFLDAVSEVFLKAKRDRHKRPKPVETDGEEILKLYNERLVKKLEQKMQDLETELARRKKAEKDVWKISKAVEQSPSIVVITDPSGIIEYVNPKFEETTGYQSGEILGKNCADLGEQTAEKTTQMFNQLNSGQDWRGVFHNWKKNGERYWERASISPICDESGSITHFVKVAEDITGQILKEKALEQERIRMDRILSALDTGLSLINRDKTIAWTNEKSLTMFPHGNPIGQICHTYYEGGDVACDPCPTMEAFETGEIREATCFNIQNEKWYHILSQPVLDKNGNVTQVLEALTDVTRKKEMADTLKKNAERLKLALEAASDGLWDWNVQTGEVYFSPRYYTMLGYEPYELPQAYETWAKLLHPEDRKPIEEKILKHIESEAHPFDQEFRLKTKSGEWKWILGKGKTFSRDKNGRPVRVVGTHTDISMLKEAEQRLRESEERYRNIIEVSPMGIAVHSGGRIVFTNQAGADLMAAARPQELVGKPVREIVHTDNWDSAVIRIDRMMAGEKGLYPAEDRYVRLDGKTIDVEVMATPLLYEGKPAVQVLVQDISQKKKTEKELKLRNEIAQIFLSAPDETIYEKILAIILDITDSRYGIFGFINASEEWVCPAFTGDIWEQCKMRNNSIVFPREQWGGLWGSAMNERKTLYSNDPFILPEGHAPINNALDVPLVYQDRLVGNFLVGRNETGYNENDASLLETVASHVAPILSARLSRDAEQEEREKAEKQLFQAQKMEAIGTLAGGIAHDFNNILTAIIGYTQLAMDSVTKENPVYDDLKEVYAGGERAKHLVGQILTFSRQKKMEIAPIEISPLIKEALKLLRSSLPSTIEIRQDIAPNVGDVLADPTQIHQIIMNLCTNASHAMREEGGLLEVTVSEVLVDETAAKENPNLGKGPFIKLSVGDSGHGIAPEALNKILEPYFTTKKRGEGTGLGLAVVHGIVESYGGTISVRSKPGKGSLFEVYLPVIQEKSEAVADETETIPGGDERILFVDDEIPIAKLGKLSLEQLGYGVTAETDPTRALERFKANPEAFELIITDMTMPKMTGDTLAREVTKIRPNMPVLLCSGLGDKETKEKALKSGVKAFIDKPTDKGKLARTVRAVLDGLKNRI